MRGYIYYKKSTSTGYISTDEGGQYFFHKDELRNCTMQQLDEGDVVDFDPSPKYFDYQEFDRAINIRKVYQATVSASSPNPGIHPNVRLDHFNDDEKKIIQFLGTIFYVSNGGAECKINESIYRYCIIKPTDFFVKSFHLSREIVVVFSDYVSFEPRSLDVASLVYSKIESKLRLDRGCYIFICHDDKVEGKLITLLKDNNLDQIVIPYTYTELISDEIDEKVIKDRFQKYLFEADLFSMTAAIKNEIFFFGRRDFAHDIASKCKRNEHCGVFGLRRSGKTSLLYAVQNLLEHQDYPTVFIPCESDLVSLDWRTALCKIVLNVYQRFDMDVSNIKEGDYQTPNTTNYFDEDLHFCLKSHSVPITLMFDEIEAITFGVSQGEDSGDLWLDGKNFFYFWNAIKGYYSKYPKEISVLVAGTNPMINEEPKIKVLNKANPMFGQLSESNQGAYLQAFTDNDTRAMVNTLGGYMGLEFNEYSIAALTKDCGGHPYLMRILCSHINKYVRDKKLDRPLTISQAIYDAASPEFEISTQAMGFFSMILDILLTSYPKEYQALKHLALNGDATIAKLMDKQALLHLIGYGLVEENQNHYAIRYDSIRRYLHGEYRYERTGLTIEDQKKEIFERSNKAEMQLRTLVKMTLLSSLGKTDAYARVINAMSDRDRPKSQLSYQQLFDPSVNKIYLSLLIKLITENPRIFSNVFEQQSVSVIKSHLWIINNARRCPAHPYDENAENWSWENFLEFRNSMEWLEEILKDYE